MSKRYQFWSFVLVMTLSTYFDLHISKNIVKFALVFLKMRYFRISIETNRMGHGQNIEMVVL